MKRPLFPALLVLALFVGLRSAGGGGETQAEGALQPLITTWELAVGQNRFAFGLSKAHKFVEGADVALRLYSIEGPEAQLVKELKAMYHPLEGIKPKRSLHRHPDGTKHVHHDDTAVRGLYVAQVTFARPGPWGIEILTYQENRFETARVTVTVLDSPLTPLVGSPAPRSHNLVANDVRDVRQIDTSERPDPRLHRVRIADAIIRGKPQVIVFATPQFCASRMCGPVVEIVRNLLPAYGSRVIFTHQEIWQDFARRKLFAAVKEWRLHSEPWIFLVDGQGLIRAKFEGLVSARELEDALRQMLTQETPR